MDDNDHQKWARIALSYLVARVFNFNGGDKRISYGELAKAIKYPEPHTGNLFGSNIGNTLGAMGHLLDNLEVNHWNRRVPLIQTLVVAQSSKSPSDGLWEFEKQYKDFTTEERKTFVNQEYAWIFEFGLRWNQVLRLLDIPLAGDTDQAPKKGDGFFNPFGSEGSPEHRKLKEFVASHGHLFGYHGNAAGMEEYRLRSGDSIDVVFRDDTQIVALEVKSIRSGLDDLERGIFQCVKYKSVLHAQAKVAGIDKLAIFCALVIENKLSTDLEKVAEKLGVLVYVEKVNA